MVTELELHIVYQDAGDGLIAASIPAVPGAFSQGHSREEARDMVLEALSLVLSPWPDEANDTSEVESLHLSVAS